MAVPVPGAVNQIWVPEGTVAPLAIGTVWPASANMLPPVAVTVVAAVDVTRNGPTAVPCGPLCTAGVRVSDGAGGFVSGPAAMTAAVMAATVLCSGSAVFRTYRSLKNQMAACT